MTDSEVKKKVEPSLVAICDEEREVVGEGGVSDRTDRCACFYLRQAGDKTRSRHTL